MALISKIDPSLQRFMVQTAITFESLQKLQKRVGTDEDLKFTDLFKYYQRETQAAKSLLYRYVVSLYHIWYYFVSIYELMTVEIFHPKAPAIFYFITCLLSCFNLCNSVYIWFHVIRYPCIVLR